MACLLLFHLLPNCRLREAQINVAVLSIGFFAGRSDRELADSCYVDVWILTRMDFQEIGNAKNE